MLPGHVGSKPVSRGRLSLRIQFQQFVGKVGEGFAHLRFARGPSRATEAIQCRLGAFQRAIVLNQVHSLERHIEPRVIRILQAHELTAPAVGLDCLQSFELADSVVHMDHVIALFEFAEIAEESRGFRPRARPFMYRCRLEKIAGAVKSQLRLGDYKPLLQRGAKQNGSRGAPRSDFFHQARASCALFELSQAIGNLVFTAKIGQAFEFAGTRRADQDFFARAESSSNFAQESLDLSPITRRWLYLEHAGLPAVPVERQLLEAESLRVVQSFLPALFR